MSEINNDIAVLITRRKQIREPPSVPFLWEWRPGVPIKNWKPEIKIQPIDHHPIDVSIPFVWEQKPGTPISFLLMDHEINSESDFSNWEDTESIGSYTTFGTDETESNRSVFVMKKTVPTLGELIMMSRKMSIRRRRAEIRNLSRDTKMERRGMSNCFNVSTMAGGNLLTGN